MRRLLLGQIPCCSDPFTRLMPSLVSVHVDSQVGKHHTMLFCKSTSKCLILESKCYFVNQLPRALFYKKKI